MSNLLDMYIKNNQLANKNAASINSVNSANSNPKVQQTKNTETKTPILQNNLSKDTYEKKDKTKKAIKYGAIGAGIAAITYSAFALIKYGKTSSNPIEAIKEPIKVLTARINPNGFKPSVSIEENEIKYMSELLSHICRLSKNQQNKYINNLYLESNFTQQGRETFLRHFSDFINR